MQFSASALSLYLHSSLLPELELQDQGHILGIVAALYSELPPALMTKVLFSVKFHMLWSFLSRTFITLPVPSSPPQNTSIRQSPKLTGRPILKSPSNGPAPLQNPGGSSTTSEREIHASWNPRSADNSKEESRKRIGKVTGRIKSTQSYWAEATRLPWINGCFMLLHEVEVGSDGSNVLSNL